MRRAGHKEMLAEVIAPRDLTIADVGCGDGGMVRHLAREGAHVVGVEPSKRQLAGAQARSRVGDERYALGSGEALPFATASVDAVLYFNSFHHLPAEVMGPALHEAARVLRPGGRLVVVEPLAEGPYFETLRPLEDETAVRALAYEVLKRPPPDMETRQERIYAAPVAFPDVDAFIAKVVAADPRRQERLKGVEDRLKQLFFGNARMDGNRFLFEQPMRMMVFDRAA